MGCAKKVKGREFLFKIALQLGMTVATLENTMSDSELQEWHEYYNLEPFHADRSELQMAVLTTIQSNKAGGKSKMRDFVISHKNEKSSVGMESMSADDINKLAGV